MIRISFAVVITLALAACGGGGGGGVAPPNVQPASLKITSGNALATTRDAYAAAEQSVGVGDMLGSSGLIAASPGAFSKGAMGPISKALSGGPALSVPLGPETQPCAVDGQVTISGNLQNPTTLTAGDNFSVLSEDCDEGFGEIIDGLLDFRVDTFSGDLLSGLYQLEITLNLTDFQVRTADDVITSNGGATVDLNALQAPFVTASIRGDSLTADSNTSSESLLGFVANQTLDGGVTPSPYTWSARGQLDSTRLGGSVDYSTPLTFEGLGTDYPHSGQLRVVGEGSSALLIAENNVDVTIEIDSNGDGEVDETISTTWADLAG